jgi:hypothetical protein
MARTRDEVKPDSPGHGAFGDAPPADRDALKRYKDSDQLQPQGKPADKRTPDAERAERPERGGPHGD